MHYQSDFEISILNDFRFMLGMKNLKRSMLIYESQTNLSGKHLTNENFLGGFDIEWYVQFVVGNYLRNSARLHTWTIAI